MPAHIGIVVLVIFVVGFSILTLVSSNFRKSVWLIWLGFCEFGLDLQEVVMVILSNFIP